MNKGIDIDEFMEKGKPININDNKVKEKLKELNGRPREELIFPINFLVTDAHYGTRALTSSNGIMGPGYSSWRTGVIPYVKLDVKPVIKSVDIPIKIIELHDSCTLEKGDVMRAYILKYRVEKRERNSGVIIGGHYIKDKFYFERDFKEEETVEKIEKLNPNNLEEVLATFGS